MEEEGGKGRGRLDKEEEEEYTGNILKEEGEVCIR